MGIPVTVDSDDIGTLILGTAALRDIEVALTTCNRDPAVMASKPKLAAAHDRISNAWRGALREKQYPERFTEARPDEVESLKALARGGAANPNGAHFADVTTRRGLMVRGFIEYGVKREQVMWGSSGQVTGHDSPDWKIRLTPRGFAAIADVEIEAPAEVQGLLGKLAAAIARWRGA